MLAGLAESRRRQLRDGLRIAYRYCGTPIGGTAEMVTEEVGHSPGFEP